MKIGVAQLKPTRGDINMNIKLHEELIFLASNGGVNAIFFPELSVTGYEPELSEKLKLSPNDARLEVFQNFSNDLQISIGVGAPTKFREEVRISMLIYEPNKELRIYSKQTLHDDEKPYFNPGNQQIVLSFDEAKIAPAICYESLQIQHMEYAIKKGANIYLASVAKSQNGVDKAIAYFTGATKEKCIPILMANCVGYCDNFQSVGQSSIWNRKGNIIGQLNETEEGILVYDTTTETTNKILRHPL